MAVATVSPRRRWMARSVRYGLPLFLLAAGIVCIILGHGHLSDTTTGTVGASPGASSPFTQVPTDRDSMFSAIGVAAIIIAAMVYMVGWFIRMNVSDGFDRKREEAARDYFARTGRWPGEPGPRGPGDPGPDEPDR